MTGRSGAAFFFATAPLPQHDADDDQRDAAGVAHAFGTQNVRGWPITTNEFNFIADTACRRAPGCGLPK